MRNDLAGGVLNERRIVKEVMPLFDNMIETAHDEPLLSAMSMPTLIDDLLAEQQQMTAVERFSRKYDSDSPPAQARYYRDLIPLNRPSAGQQYAFGVDLDACTGCKACVSACHSLNGLDEEETWRNVGVLHGGGEEPYLQTVTTACHHCVEPACLEGCPVMAYEKCPETGIVRHLDDQCIGCQYCVLKCPYDVPKYSAKKGIVRKCDMCATRLARDEAPACVQACPTQAIRIDIVAHSSIYRSTVPGTQLVPGACDSAYTKPSTRYRTSRKMPSGVCAGGGETPRLEHSHWPLIGMLLFTQMSVGVFGVLAALAIAQPGEFDTWKGTLSMTGAVLLFVGLGVSVLHLGRPLGAWRFFLGLRTSWMSREILAFGVLAPAALVSTIACGWGSVVSWIPSISVVESIVDPGSLARPLVFVTLAVGLAAVFSSAMIYIDTRRPFWAARLTFPRFFGSTLLLGTTIAAFVFAGGSSQATYALRFVLLMTGSLGVIIRAGLFAWEARNFARSLQDLAASTHRSALAMWELRPKLVLSSLVLFIVSITAGMLSIRLVGYFTSIAAMVALGATLAAQIVERYFFFTAVVAPRMPGGIAS